TNMANILEAIFNISTLSPNKIKEITLASNGSKSLEIFIKNSFAGVNSTDNENEKSNKYSNFFSFEGNKTDSPNLIIKGGDAIEIKKTKNIKSDIQLNSSYPKAKLKSNSPITNKHCRNCEEWNEKDIIYIIGHIPRKTKKLSSLWLTFGNIYAADEEIYTFVENLILDSLDEIGNITFSKTKEICRVNYIDPLKITNIKIRDVCLFQLQPPVKVYNYVYEYQPHLNFQLVAFIPTKKYLSFPNESRNKIEFSTEINIQEVHIKDPNNIVNLIPCKLITFEIPQS
ncbi:MAG: NgoPII family restriction endonuclease, partial [Saprospiraceae bacterium]